MPDTPRTPESLVRDAATPEGRGMLAALRASHPLGDFAGVIRSIEDSARAEQAARLAALVEALGELAGSWEWQAKDTMLMGMAPSVYENCASELRASLAQTDPPVVGEACGFFIGWRCEHPADHEVHQPMSDGTFPAPPFWASHRFGTDPEVLQPASPAPDAAHGQPAEVERCGAFGQDHSDGCPASDTYPLSGTTR